MSTYKQYYCTSCYNVWDQNQYIPKILDCGHSFCLKCLQRLFKNNQIICPHDMKSIKIDSLNQLITNQELLNPHLQQDISIIKSDYITQSTTRLYIPDNSITIHKPLYINQKEQQISQTREQLQQCHQHLQQSHQQFQLNQQTNFNEANRMIIQYKQTIIQQIQQNFSDFQIKLKNLEKQLLNELNIVSLKLEDNIKQIYIDNKEIIEILTIKQRIEQLLLLSNENLNTKIDLINSLTQQTQYVINNLTKQPSLIIQDILTKEIQIKFDHTIYDYLPQFCTIKKYNKNQQQNKSRIKTLNDSNSNNHINNTLYSPKSKGYDYSIQKPFQYSKNAQQPPYQRLNPRELTFGGQVQTRISHDSKNSKSLSSSKLYQVTGINRIQDLLFKGLSIDKLDLTNQNLSDQDIQDLITMIKQSNSYIEILKLVKNRITDNGLDYLLILLIQRSDIHTLNLSNNDCTDKSINIIERRIQQLIGKTIYLSNCKINNLNQLKQKQIIFQNRGVTLFL